MSKFHTILAVSTCALGVMLIEAHAQRTERTTSSADICRQTFTDSGDQAYQNVFCMTRPAGGEVATVAETSPSGTIVMVPVPGVAPVIVAPPAPGSTVSSDSDSLSSDSSSSSGGAPSVIHIPSTGRPSVVSGIAPTGIPDDALSSRSLSEAGQGRVGPGDRLHGTALDHSHNLDGTTRNAEMGERDFSDEDRTLANTLRRTTSPMTNDTRPGWNSETGQVFYADVDKQGNMDYSTPGIPEAPAAVRNPQTDALAAAANTRAGRTGDFFQRQQADIARRQQAAAARTAQRADDEANRGLDETSTFRPTINTQSQMLAAQRVVKRGQGDLTFQERMERDQDRRTGQAVLNERERQDREMEGFTGTPDLSASQATYRMSVPALPGEQISTEASGGHAQGAAKTIARRKEQEIYEERHQGRPDVGASERSLAASKAGRLGHLPLKAKRRVTSADEDFDFDRHVNTPLRNRERNMERLKAEADLRFAEENPRAPDLSATSRSPVTRQVAETRVAADTHEELYKEATGRRERLATARARQDQAEMQEVTGTPQINARSRVLVRDGNVADRLHALAATQAQRLDARRDERDTEIDADAARGRQFASVADQTDSIDRLNRGDRAAIEPGAQRLAASGPEIPMTRAADARIAAGKAKRKALEEKEALEARRKAAAEANRGGVHVDADAARDRMERSLAAPGNRIVPRSGTVSLSQLANNMLTSGSTPTEADRTKARAAFNKRATEWEQTRARAADIAVIKENQTRTVASKPRLTADEERTFREGGVVKKAQKEALAKLAKDLAELGFVATAPAPAGDGAASSSAAAASAVSQPVQVSAEALDAYRALLKAETGAGDDDRCIQNPLAPNCVARRMAQGASV